MILKHKKTQILFFAISFFCFIFILLFGLRNNVKDLNKELLQVKKGINEEQNLIKILEKFLQII